MTRSCCARWCPLWGRLAVLVLAPAVPVAADKARPTAAEAVELFTAMESGQVEVRAIPKNSAELKVIVANKTSQPLIIRLPEVFAAVPALAQAGRIPGMNRNPAGNPFPAVPGANGNPGKTQGLGSGVGQKGVGLMSIPPEKAAHWKGPAVCLEHDKRGPHSAAYEIRPIESLIATPEVREVCRLLGEGETPQRVAQAAAWHLANNMSWERLAAKESHSVLSRSGTYFTQQEIREAKSLVDKAAKATARAKAEKSKLAMRDTN